MIRNVGRIDRLIRFSIAELLVLGGHAIHGSATFTVGLAMAALLPILSGLFGICPLYNLFGLDTRFGRQDCDGDCWR